MTTTVDYAVTVPMFTVPVFKGRPAGERAVLILLTDGVATRTVEVASSPAPLETPLETPLAA